MASSTSHPTAAAKGGTVEPANRSQVAKETFQLPLDEGRGERFELRDPFAEVTYRSTAAAEIRAKAEQLGSDRYTAIDEDGKRTVVRKVDGEWQRGPQLAAAKERPLDPAPLRDDVSVAATDGTKRSAPAMSKQAGMTEPTAVSKVEMDAERAAMVARIEDVLKDRYIIKRAPVSVGALTVGQTEYRFRADTSRIAFTESTFRLATDTNSPSVARSMVDVAQARNWKGLRVSGAEDFRRLVWLEASVRGVKAVGYEPNPGDLDVLKREREARQTNRIEPAPETRRGTSGAATEKSSARGGGRKAVVAAIEAVLVAKNVPEAKRAAVLAAATEKLAQRIRSEQPPKVKVYDIAAKPQRTTPPLTPQQGHTQDRPAPSHAR